MKFLKLFSREKIDHKNFFDYPSREQIKIIRKAAEEANKKQLQLVKRYQTLYCPAE